jgi:putative addiction module killer protein
MSLILWEIREYLTPDGKSPFREWIHDLKDRIVAGRIMKRLERIKVGLFGDYQSLGGGLFELRFHFGAGYRVYFGEVGNNIIVLLCGGDKSSQRHDIEKATSYLDGYK